MKKLISITLLSAVAMLATAPTAAPKAQNTTAPATTVKKATKKHHVKAKTAVKPVAPTPAAK